MTGNRVYLKDLKPGDRFAYQSVGTITVDDQFELLEPSPILSEVISGDRRLVKKVKGSTVMLGFDHDLVRRVALS